MKPLILLALLVFCPESWSNDSLLSKINQVDPYSIESLEKYFPESVEKTLIVERSTQGIPKRTGPILKEERAINYQVLVPHLLVMIKDQQNQIEALRAQITKSNTASQP